ncbi:MAG TPA: hypothetical protein VGB92_04320 [Longimicrobium sp.]|jgi:hypothetical protein
MRRLLAPLILVPALLACSMNTPGDSGTGSGTPASGQAPAQPAAANGPVTVEFKQREPGGEPDGATGGTGTVAVRGTISTPNPCFALSGTATREGSTLTLTVSARSTADMCIQSIGTLAFDATLKGVPAGSYTLRVVHTYGGTGWETKTAMTQQVQVR